MAAVNIVQEMPTFLEMEGTLSSSQEKGVKGKAKLGA